MAPLLAAASLPARTSPRQGPSQSPTVPLPHANPGRCGAGREVAALGVGAALLRRRGRPPAKSAVPLRAAAGSGSEVAEGGKLPDGFSLPPFCGAVVSPLAEVFVIGVAHRDNGLSGRAARELIRALKPDVCVVELDRNRFSRLLATQRRLPWSYAPTRGSKFQPGPVMAAFRNGLFQGLRIASQIAGIAEKGGTEFFDAFEEADASGALVVPVDVPLSNALDRLTGALRWGIFNPVAQITTGVDTLIRAGGGIFSRPQSSSESSCSYGIAIPEALLSDEGGRLGPLTRSIMAGGISAVLLSLLITRFAPRDEALKAAQANDIADGFGLFVLLVIVVVVVSVLASAFLVSFIRDRDEHMVTQLTSTLAAMDRVCPAQDESYAGTAPSGVLWCRWVKRTWAASQTPWATGQAQLDVDVTFTRREEKDTTWASDSSVAARAEHRKLPGPWVLPVLPLPSASSPDGGLDRLLVFTAKRPLLEGQTRRLSIFEPRLLRAVDALVAAGARVPGLSLALFHALHGSERPVSFSATSPEPPLSVEVDALVEASGRIAEVEEMWETRGEDGRRRWRLLVRGGSKCLNLADCSLAADNLGALWASPGAATPCKAEAGSDAAPSAEKLKPMRCVAVVGLVHVNGVVQGMQQSLRRLPSGLGL